MKTKTILKTLAVALLMPAMLLTTACSNEDDLTNNTVNSQPVANKGYALPVTVSATRQGDGTRATYNESTKKLEFSTGDKLFVYGSATAAGSFAGELDYVPATGKFSGTIYTQKEWTGTPDALFTAASAGGNITATLLPNGYGANGSNSFLSINNNSTTDIAYDDRLTVSFSKAFVASETAKATGVEQLSLERTSTYSSGFALAPLCAILNFTITGLEAGPKNVSLQLSGFDNTVTGSVTPNAGVATFAIGVSGGANIKDMDNNLTVGTHNFTLPSTTLTAGKIYNITRAVPAATSLSELKTAINGGTDCSSYIGWEVNSEGAIAKSGVSGTKIGYVAYVSTSDVDAGVSGSRILVIASADAGTSLQWGSKGTARGLEAVNNANDLKGYSNTNTLQGYGSEAHPAAYAAWNYSATIPSGGATPAHWFMPTKKQWENMRDAKGGAYSAMKTAYGIDGHYWTSNEFFNGTNYNECKNYAWRFVTNSNFQGNMKSLNFNVRSIFAY